MTALRLVERDEPGDPYLYWIERLDRRRCRNDYQSLCRGLVEQAIADIWCVRRGEIGRVGLVALSGRRREPRTATERRHRASAIAWLRGDNGTASEPWRWIDCCEALAIDPIGVRRTIIEERRR